MPKLYVICGHGDGDPGAMGNGYKEAEQVRRLAERIKHFGGDEVIVHPTDRNPYAENDLRDYDFPEGVYIVEIHRDSAGPNARGAHVIIDGDLKADEYDKALADFVASMFPGRSEKLVKRNNLRNVNQAANRGLNYRLVENGFISNDEDCRIFEENLDTLAKGYLSPLGITKVDEIVLTPDPEPNPVKVSSAGNALVKQGQAWLVKNGYDLGKYSIDGVRGADTRKALVMCLQTVLNRYGARLKVDGVYGPKTAAALQKYGPVMVGCARKELVRVVQCALLTLGYGIGPCGIDGICGYDTETAIIAIQRANKLKTDGKAGKETGYKLF